MGALADPQPLLISIDFEDWHQLVRRRLGASDWEQPGPALERQTQRLLELLDELEVRATFFVLGMSARAHPHLVERVASRGHELACHGDRHLPVHSQTPAEFAADLRASRHTIEQLTGQVAKGYRAPAFSITADCPWAYQVLVQEGFAYDASQHDSPRIRRRMAPRAPEPHPLQINGDELWEFPVAVSRGRRTRLPVGGASYWALMPTRTVLRGLERAGDMAGLYLHPQELDPEPLRVGLHGASPGQRARSALRSTQRNLARRRTPKVLAAIAERHPLIPYGEAHARLTGSATARS